MQNIRIIGIYGANVRKQPTLDSDVVRRATYNESLGVRGNVLGESFAGNNVWYEALDGFIWSGNAELIPEIQVYGQRDSKWRNARLGYSPDYPDLATRLYYMARGWIIPGSIGMYGCTISCIGSYGRISPNNVNDLFVRHGVYGGATQNLVVWANVARAIPNIGGVKILWGYDNAEVLVALAHGDGVLAEVNAQPLGVPGGRHWVRMIGKGKIVDPWFGDIAPTARYEQYYSLRILLKK